jgi:hypothetical protein
MRRSGFKRLKAEHRLQRRLLGGEGVCLRGADMAARETFVPLAHPAGHAQVDFGEAFGGDRRRASEAACVLHGPSALGRAV